MPGPPATRWSASALRSSKRSAGRWLSACAAEDPPVVDPGSGSSRLTANEALLKLMEGNQRWVNSGVLHPNQTAVRRIQVASGQQPWAVVFSYIDSRGPPELVFDQGLGDMFVVRTAGHVIDNAALGSIEFGAEASFYTALFTAVDRDRAEIPRWGRRRSTIRSRQSGSPPVRLSFAHRVLRGKD